MVQYRIHGGAMGLLALYALAKYILAGPVMEKLNIVPHYFLFLDLITIPPYVLGWAKLIVHLKNPARVSTGHTLAWSGVTLISSLAPYLYAAWAGHSKFPPGGWLIMGLILLIPIINWIRKGKNLPYK
ncbi:MAG: hypothetical protein MI747_18370 [Desulfobacterales bacterium]|nr:hypothetical protein [Desulfobacterales bacterium]